MSVQVKVVNVLATVRDKHGKIVNGLTKDDFTLTEDGRPQTIHYFARETDLPLTLGLLVDTSMSQRRVLGEERDASQSFLAQMLREDKDKAFVIHFDREVELLQDLTSSHEKLRAALESLDTPQFTRTSPGGGGGEPIPDRRLRDAAPAAHGGGTLLYDAVFLASDELMEKQPGRKAVIVLSDGVDMGSKESLEAAIESAQRANTIVYSILFKDDEAYGNGGGFGRTGISIPGMGGPAWAAAEWGPGRARRAALPGTACRRQEGPGAHLQGNRRTHVRSLEEGTGQPDLFPDSRRAAQSVQPGLHAQSASSPDITRSRWPRPRKISSFRPATDTTETNKSRYRPQAARETLSGSFPCISSSWSLSSRSSSRISCFNSS